MLELQKYLKNKSPEDLQNEYKINFKKDPEFPNLHLFKYGIDAPMGERICQESRGIILDSNEDWKIVSRAFDKFFNYHEGHAAKINWENAKVQEKLDGSLMIVYPYKGKWRIQSSGSPNASGSVGSENFTFADYFWRTAEKRGLTLPDPNINCCFSFELTGPANRVVVQHNEENLTILGARNLNNQKEFFPNHLGQIVPVRSFPLKSFEEITKSFEEISPLVQEGYVVVDDLFQRIKIKHPSYVAMHHAKDSFTPKNFLEIIRGGESNEFISYFPEFQIQMNNIRIQYEKLIEKIHRDWEKYKIIPTQKDFALAVKHLKYSGVLFNLRSGKISSVAEGLQNLTIDKLEELVLLN